MSTRKTILVAGNSIHVALALAALSARGEAAAARAVEKDPGPVLKFWKPDGRNVAQWKQEQRGRKCKP